MATKAVNTGHLSTAPSFHASQEGNKIINPAPSPASSTLAADQPEFDRTTEAPSREERLSAYIKGDESAFEELFQEIGASLFAFIGRYLGDFHQAEDVYQNVLIKIACKAATFQAHAKVTTWIFQVARNACLDELRSENRRPKVISDKSEHVSNLMDTGLQEATPQPVENLINHELGLKIELAVQSLPDEQREVFLLKEEGGFTFEEIAAITSCGRETCKSRMRYALERLRNTLSHEARHYGLQ